MENLSQFYIKYIIAGFFFCFLRPGNAQEQISKTNTSAVIRFNLAEYSLMPSEISEIISVPGKTFVTMAMQDEQYGVISDPGYPALPQYSMYIHLPSNARNVKVLMQTERIGTQQLPEGLYIEPFVEYGVNGVDGESYNKSYYEVATSPYITEFFSVSEPFSVMGEMAVCLTVLPFQYVPRSGNIQILHFADFLISWDLVGSETKSTSSTQARESFLNSIFTNYTDVPKIETKGKMLIITDPKWEDGLSTFSQYKENIGLEVLTVTTNATGRNVSDIKNYIKNTSFKPDFVLLVGSISDIPYASGDPLSDLEDPMTDQGYRRWGNDDKVYGDVFLGRWPVQTSQDLGNIINKTFEIENKLSNLPKKAVFLAGKENRGYMEKQFRKGHDRAIKLGFHEYQCDKYYQSEKNTLDLLQYSYPAWFSYSGHGSLQGLCYGSSYIIKSTFFQCPNVYPFVFSFACLTGNYASREYVAASILDEYGPVTFFASSVMTFCNSDVAIEEKVLGESFSQISIGAMITEGMTRYRQRFWSRLNLTRTRRYQKSYNLMGDPSLLKSGLNNGVVDYVFNKPLIAKGGVNISYECLRNIDIKNKVHIDYSSALKFIAVDNFTMMSNVRTDPASSLQVTAGNISVKDGTRIEQGSNVVFTARDAIRLEPGIIIDSGCEVLLSVQ